MSDLPARPGLDQLRHQAKDLLHAAQRGDPALSWGTVGGDGTFTMFRRAKLWLDAIDPATLDAVRRYGSLIAHLGLADTKGHPLCAAVRPPLIQWSAAPTG